MKNFRLVIGVVVILAVVCSPALGISSSDLISQHQGQSVPTIPTPVTPLSYVMPSSDDDTPFNCDPTIFEGLRHYDPNSTYVLNIHNIAVPMTDTPRVPIPRIEFPDETSADGGIPEGPSCCTLFEKLMHDEGGYVMPTSDDSDPVTIRWDPRIAISLDEITPRPNNTVIHGITIPRPNTRGL